MSCIQATSNKNKQTNGFSKARNLYLEYVFVKKINNKDIDAKINVFNEIS